MVDLKSLNAHQKEAVETSAKYVRIIAGAGSGKTRVLTTRIVHLIEDVHVFPSKILAITFTNKAAKEMKERVSKMLGEGSASPFVSTIHSLCVRILREDIHVSGWPRNFTIMDTEDQKVILKEAYKKYEVDISKVSYSSMLNFISVCKVEKATPQQALVFAGIDEVAQKKVKIYLYYLQRQQEIYALDFDDLILKTVDIFKAYPEVLAKWQRRFSHILVDEFQDIDKTQYTLIRLLTGNDNDLLVVGDPDQTIYTWRGADVNIIMHFEKDFPSSKTIILNQNYRSTDCILNGANGLIKHNKNRIDKELFTEDSSEVKITHYSAVADEYEAAWLAETILQLHRQGKAYKDMAVLYRSNYLSRSLEKGLRDARIPYVIYGGLRFFDRQEIKDGICYLRMCVTSDDLAFNRIINVPKRGVGSKTLDSIRAIADEEHTTMYEVLKTHVFKGKAGEQLHKFVQMVERWKSILQEEDVDYVRLFEKILEDSGYRDMLMESKETERIENLKELMDDIREYFEDNPDQTLEEYLQEVTLLTDREQVLQSDFVQLMTVHASKGLEFDTVFVTDLNEGIFPNERALQDSHDGVEEERRLAYVAFTRARKKLYLLDAGGFSFILQRVLKPSRFIREIDEEYIEHLGSQLQQLQERRESSFIQPDEEPLFIKKKKLPAEKGAKLKKGDLVVHAIFGEGIVISVEKDLVNVAFDRKYGVKKLKSSFLKRKEELRS